MTLRELQKNAKQLVRDWKKIRSQALENTKEIAIDLITDDQLYDKGIDGNGQKLDPYRNPEYEKLKETLNPNRVTDLQLSGSWVDGLRGIVRGDDMTINSSDSKSPKLHRKYGDAITDLTAANKSVYSSEYVLPELQKLTRKSLKL